MLDDHLQQAALNAAQTCIQTATHFFTTTFPVPTISYRLRGKAAGKAYLQPWEIRLNPVLFQENPQAFIEDVIPHEIAHLLAFRLFGPVKPHGREWQQVMTQVFNRPAKVTHNLNIESVMGTTFDYQCDCQIHQLSLRRHNNVQRHQAIYHCKKCHGILKFTGQKPC